MVISGTVAIRVVFWLVCYASGALASMFSGGALAVPWLYCYSGGALAVLWLVCNPGGALVNM